MICEACGDVIQEYYNNKITKKTAPHEIKSRGAGGKCIESNQLNLCVNCHRFYHQAGYKMFIFIFPELEDKVRKALGKED